MGDARVRAGRRAFPGTAEVFIYRRPYLPLRTSRAPTGGNPRDDADRLRDGGTVPAPHLPPDVNRNPRGRNERRVCREHARELRSPAVCDCPIIRLGRNYARRLTAFRGGRSATTRIKIHVRRRVFNLAIARN